MQLLRKLYLDLAERVNDFALKQSQLRGVAERIRVNAAQLLNRFIEFFRKLAVATERSAQFFGFEQPNRWMTSGGLGTMGYGLPAAFGVQIAHPDALVIDIAGDASIQMCIQEMSAAIQYEAPIKIFILNNQYMGMVRQWQQLLHGNRLSHSYTEAMPDFVKLAEAYGAVGLRCEKPGDLDGAIDEMIAVKKPVIFDCRVANLANCFPMIPSGKAHNEMLLPDEATDEAVANAIDAKGRQLV